MIKSEDFKNSHLKVDKAFNIKNENAIYLGPNGIGKTTTYSILKQKYPTYGFFSYDDCKEKITKEKKKITISIRTTDIEELKKNKEEIINNLDIKNNGFKKYGITSGMKAGEYSDYCKDIYNNPENGILNFNNNKIVIFNNIEDETKKLFLLQNIDNIENISITGLELENIRNKYISDSLKFLENAIDENDTICPVCGYDHKESILKLYKEKEKIYRFNLDSVIEKYMLLTNKSKNEVQTDILEMIDLVKNNNLNKIDATNYIIIGKDTKNVNDILDAKKEIKDINDEIAELEIERDLFYNNLIDNWDKVEKTLKEAFKETGVKVEKDDVQKSIIISLKREASTYSTGELNYIVFLINILEFEYSNRKNIVIDDPLSSYDIKKQYEIVFDIMSRLIKNQKKVIIFTHNINLINIINSQYPSKFSYYFIDSINNEIKNYQLNIKDDGSILNIDELLDYIDDSLEEKQWIKLLIDKDLKWEETSERHKLFHYDEEYTDELTGLSNMDLYNLVENFETITTGSFELMSAKKILLLCSMRIWIEKKLTDNYNGKLNGNQLFPKIKEYFKHKENWKKDLHIEQEDLTKRKVMLNQNNHYKSQIIPFQYALSISTDELIRDINETKNLFK